MSIQHFAAAPGKIISFLLSSCLKSLAESATLLIGSREELRCAPPISGEEGREREREGWWRSGGVIHNPHRCLEFLISAL